MKLHALILGLPVALLFLPLMSCTQDVATTEVDAEEEEATIVDVGDGKEDAVPALATRVGSKFAFNAGVERLELSKCDKSKAECNMSPDFVNAYWLLYLSELAYKPKAEIQSGLKAVGLKPAEFVFFNNEYSGAQAYYIEVGNIGIAAFRGTQEDEIVDFTTDANTALQNGLHSGFAEQFRSIWQYTYEQADTLRTDMGSYLQERFPSGTKKRLYLTGHSLGAALSTLALASAINAGFPVQALYNYGGPRVMNAELAVNLYEVALSRNIPIYRWVHGDDIVPTIPVPAILRDYQHPGQEEWQTLYHISATPPIELTTGEMARSGGLSVEQHYPDKYNVDMKSYFSSDEAQKALRLRHCGHKIGKCPN